MKKNKISFRTLKWLALLGVISLPLALQADSLTVEGKLQVQGDAETGPDLSSSGDKGVLFEGVSGGAIPREGVGNRMMWYPGKAAFRAGGVINDPVNGYYPTWWDDLFVGSHSTAFGLNARAEGDNSFASGAATQAIGVSSHAFGHGTIASGPASFASGFFTQSTGNGSTAFGNFSWATNYSATAMGFSCTASGDSSLAGGVLSEASGDYSVAIGSSAGAEGSSSTAFGAGTTASGSESTAMGAGSTASGQQSTAMGAGSTASGGKSTAMGAGTTASGEVATAMGAGTTADTATSLVIGAINQPSGGSLNMWQPQDPLFVIGNGVIDDPFNPQVVIPHNALTVLKNGKVIIEAVNPAIFDPPFAPGAPDELLEVNGDVEITGKLTLVQPQGDIPMITY